jgi:hypothetical protein
MSESEKPPASPTVPPQQQPKPAVTLAEMKATLMARAQEAWREPHANPSLSDLSASGRSLIAAAAEAWRDAMEESDDEEDRDKQSSMEQLAAEALPSGDMIRALAEDETEEDTVAGQLKQGEGEAQQRSVQISVYRPMYYVVECLLLRVQ